MRPPCFKGNDRLLDNACFQSAVKAAEVASNIARTITVITQLEQAELWREVLHQIRSLSVLRR